MELGLFGASLLFLFLLLPIARAIISYFQGNKHLGIAFFIASIISCLVAFNSVYSFSDRRVIIVITTLLCFLISIHQREKLRNDGDHQKHL